MRWAPLLAAMLAGLCAAAAARGETRARAPVRNLLEPVSRLELHGVEADAVTYRGRRAVHLRERREAGRASPETETIAIVPGPEPENGSVEIDLAGEPRAGAREGARGFVGVAFRVARDASRFECFYLRPTNGRAPDQLRRNHATQYVSFPDFPWDLLRKETPGVYESYVDLVPGEWTRVKIVFEGSKARLYVHGAGQPTLLVDDLKLPPAPGRIALWIGLDTEAWFSNLAVRTEPLRGGAPLPTPAGR